MLEIRGQRKDYLLQTEKEVDAENWRRLLLRDWTLEKGGLWSHPSYRNQDLPVMFTFEEAVKKEGL